MKAVSRLLLLSIAVLSGLPACAFASASTQPVASRPATSQPAEARTAAYPHFGVTVPLFDRAEIIPEPFESQIVAQGWPSAQAGGGLDRVLSVFLVGRAKPGETAQQFADRQARPGTQKLVGKAQWGGLSAVIVAPEPRTRRGLSPARTAYAIHDGFGYALTYLDKIEPKPQLADFEFALAHTKWTPRSALTQSLSAGGNLKPLAAPWAIEAPEPLRAMKQERPDLTAFYAEELRSGFDQASARAVMLKVITAGPDGDFGSLDATKDQISNAVFKPRGLADPLPWRDLPTDESLGEGAVSAPFRASNGEWMAGIIRRDAAKNTIVVIASAKLVDTSDAEMAFLAKYVATAADSIRHKK